MPENTDLKAVPRGIEVSGKYSKPQYFQAIQPFCVDCI
jgi:hypothetical protein